MQIVLKADEPNSLNMLGQSTLNLSVNLPSKTCTTHKRTRQMIQFLHCKGERLAAWVLYSSSVQAYFLNSAFWHKENRASWACSIRERARLAGEALHCERESNAEIWWSIGSSCGSLRKLKVRNSYLLQICRSKWNTSKQLLVKVIEDMKGIFNM